jgi:hypothetical protein
MSNYNPSLGIGGPLAELYSSKSKAEFEKNNNKSQLLEH